MEGHAWHIIEKHYIMNSDDGKLEMFSYYRFN